MDLTALLPPFIVERLIAGIRDFDRKMPGYIHPDAIVVAPESRTSSPVRMPRDKAYPRNGRRSRDSIRAGKVPAMQGA